MGVAHPAINTLALNALSKAAHFRIMIFPLDVELNRPAAYVARLSRELRHSLPFPRQAHYNDFRERNPADS
ncbi:hypothetical protein BSFA1_45840 [Burkholderia sp. SFA1]|nr:hypothetical protein BSFA1_45840 [Burkholderia sp. SFA1]